MWHASQTRCKCISHLVRRQPRTDEPARVAGERSESSSSGGGRVVGGGGRSILRRGKPRASRWSVSNRFDSNRFDAIRFDAIRFDPIRFDLIRFDPIRFDSIQLPGERAVRVEVERARSHEVVRAADHPPDLERDIADTDRSNERTRWRVVRVEGEGRSPVATRREALWQLPLQGAAPSRRNVSTSSQRRVTTNGAQRSRGAHLAARVPRRRGHALAAGPTRTTHHN